LTHYIDFVKLTSEGKMHDLLAEIFIQKGIIKYNTKVSANYITEQFGGVLKLEAFTDFSVVRAIKMEDGSIVFDLKQVNDNTRHRVPTSAIQKIEGMDPARIASVYNLKADGTEKTVGRKRGRKPRIIQEVLKNAG
jgi:hypothetical protein